MRLSLPPEGDLARLVRSAAAESLVVFVEPGRDALALALARAAVAPLAMEVAPVRLNMVLPADGADPADVAAAVAWLEGAASTTGQLVEVDASPRVRPHGPSDSTTKR